MTNHFMVHVIADYQVPYPDPIQTKEGDDVNVDLSKETNIDGWVWCTNRDGKSGWVPNVYVEIEGDKGRMLQDYNAIELTIRVGDILKVHKEESSFYWVSNQSGEQGWVPIDKVEVMDEQT